MPSEHSVAMDRPAQQPVIQLDNVCFCYSGTAKPALDGISLSIHRGERVCVLGGNGSGKSTFAQMLNALLIPNSGTSRIFGLDSALPGNALAIRRRAAMVFQHPEDQMTSSVVADDVAFGPENLGVAPAEIARRVDDALRIVGLADRARSNPADLSGGQRQRVAIAGALAMKPDLLVLDEPCAMLDTEGRLAIRKVVHGLSDEGITVVHVTHFMGDALDADRVIVLDQGRIALDTTPADAFSQRDLIDRLGLELPPSMHLAGLLEPRGIVIGAADIPGAARQIASKLPAHAKADARKSTHPKSCEGFPARAENAIVFDSACFCYSSAENARRKSWMRFKSKRAKTEDLALDSVSFCVPRGSITALVGRTGSGKSTAVELACALKVPLKGSVHVNGIDVCDLSRRAELRRSIAYVSQLPERQLFAQTVFDDIAFGPRNLGLSPDETSRRVRAALEATGIEATDDLLERSPFALSGGQQRCVALAGVLAMRHPILVLDEPMAGLDPAGRSRLASLLLQLKHEGTTLLLVTHSMDDVAMLADHVVALDNGRVIAENDPRGFFLDDSANNPLVSRLGMPAALSFASELSSLGIELDNPPLTLDELANEVIRYGCSR